MPLEFDKKLPNSKAFDRIFTSNFNGARSLHFFTTSREPQDLAELLQFRPVYALTGTDTCFEKPFTSGQKSHSDHALWHTLDDRHMEHAHFIKGEGELITPTEFSCILQTELSNEEKVEKNGYLELGLFRVKADKKDLPYISETDRKALLDSYTAYYQHETQEKEALNEVSLALQAERRKIVSQAMFNSAKSLLAIFLRQMIDRYFIPALIDRYHLNYQKQMAIKSALHAATTFVLTSFNVSSTLINFSLRFLIGQALRRFGLDPSLFDRAMNYTSTVLLLLDNPGNLASLLAIAGASATGEKLASLVIQQLSKSKQEDEKKENYRFGY